MKALIIGGTGPTGPYVVEGLLKRGYEVSILHRGSHEVAFPEDVEHIHADPHFVESIKKALEKRKFEITVGMYGRLRYVAEAIKGHTQKFIAIGGLPYKVFFLGHKHPDGVPVPVSEEAVLFTEEEKNKFTYLMTVSEWAVFEAHQNGYYQATLLRYPFIYGPRQLAPREWSIMRRLLDGRRQIIVPDGGLKLERKAYAENAAHAVLLCVDNFSRAEGKIYNVGDESMLSLRDWINAIASVLNCAVELVSIPFSLARPARAYTGRDFHQVPDISKIKTQLNYQDLVPIREAIRRTVCWYLEKRPEPGGEIEQKLLDPFDYATEDKIIQEYRRWEEEMRRITDVGFRWRHPYDHPTGSGNLK